MTDGRCFGEQHGRCPTVPDEARHSDFLVPVHSRDGWAARWARSAAGYSAKVARWKVEWGSDDYSTAEEPACSGVGCKSMAARWRVERHSADYQGMTAGNSAAHLSDDCSTAEEPACSGAGCRSMAARWKVEQDLVDYRGMTAGNSAAHSRGDCLVVPRPQAGLAD